MSDVTPHALIAFTGMGLDPAWEAIDYHVGPPCSCIEFYPPPYGKHYLVLWGEHLTEKHLRDLADACTQLEREYATDGIYDGARNAERAASAFHRAEK
jgi:hypothetical protein